jgi:hypothetical protein
MQEILTVIKVYLLSILLGSILSHVVGVVQKHYIDVDRQDFDSQFESGE